MNVHVYIWHTIRLIMKPVYPIGIFEMMILLKLKICLYFRYLLDKIHRTHMKLRFIMNSATLICIWIPVFPIGIFEVSTIWKWCFCLHFSAILDYLLPNTRNSLVYNSWSEMERCENRAFLLLKMRNIKNKYVTDVFFCVTSSSVKDNTCH